MRSILAFYEIDRSYGGPEEGGWYFDSGTFVRAMRVHLTDADATVTVTRDKLDVVVSPRLPEAA